MPASIVAVVGPTATGKSDLGIELAQACGGEVINADAFQLYRGLDIGTAKVLPEARRGIAHHQIDVLTPLDRASVAAYQQAARADVAAVQQCGYRPIVVGGSGLYVRALLDQIEFPGTDPDVRAALTARAEREGTPALYAELAMADPLAAEQIGPHNIRRIVRALEAIEVTGRPFSATLPRGCYVQPTLVIGLDAPREWLDVRVAQRVEKMWADGLVDEVHSLATPAQGGIGPGLGETAARAVGYAEVLELLAGRADEIETKTAIAANTRRLTRKQMGWFGRDPRIVWLDATAPDLLDQAQEVLAAFDAGQLHLPAPRHEPRAEPTRRPLGSVSG